MRNDEKLADVTDTSCAAVRVGRLSEKGCEYGEINEQRRTPNNVAARQTVDDTQLSERHW